MEVASSPAFWWLKSNKTFQDNSKADESRQNLTSTPKQSEDPSTISSSLRDFLEKERAVQSPSDADTDIGSIIEEINKLAAQSPLGPYEIKDSDEVSIEEIMKEAERIYMESSKSFEQLSLHSRTSANLSLSLNDSSKSTPTPKSASPLPLDSERAAVEDHKVEGDNDDSYSDDFTQDYRSETKNENVTILPIAINNLPEEISKSIINSPISLDNENYKSKLEEVTERNSEHFTSFSYNDSKFSHTEIPSENKGEDDKLKGNKAEQVQSETDQEDIQKLQHENKNLLDNITALKVQLDETNQSLAKTKATLKTESTKLTDTNMEKRLLEELKDTQESKTALQLQYDELNQSYQLLKITYDKLVISNSNLEKRLLESELILSKCKSELANVQQHQDKLLESETNLTKLLEIEKLQVKSLRAQNDKDARCIQDLNRQVKEMERIIARKHPDSVSALIVAAKTNHGEDNLSARKLLEDRIKNLEGEVKVRDQQSSKVFLDVQEKFTEMKNKYESHIEDLELHVNDLKDQLKRKVDTFDVYTQTFFDEQKIPVKEAKDASVQTFTNSGTRLQVQKLPVARKAEKIEVKEETHLLATIRGLQTDVLNKEKVVFKLQRELDEARKTNRRLQKEREGSLKNIVERGREFRSYPEKLAAIATVDSPHMEIEDWKVLKADNDKMKTQLCRMEEDYQNLKAKRLFDLSALQQAHEQEISTYMTNITPLREQLELHQLTVNTLQEQLRATKEQMDALTTERDDLYNRLHCRVMESDNSNSNDHHNINVVALEKRYQERECRLRSILHGLSQKNVGNQGCKQCAARQQQLILYKTELDQLLATLRTLA